MAVDELCRCGCVRLLMAPGGASVIHNRIHQTPHKPAAACAPTNGQNDAEAGHRRACRSRRQRFQAGVGAQGGVPGRQAHSAAGGQPCRPARGRRTAGRCGPAGALPVGRQCCSCSGQGVRHPGGASPALALQALGSLQTKPIAVSITGPQCARPAQLHAVPISRRISACKSLRGVVWPTIGRIAWHANSLVHGVSGRPHRTCCRVPPCRAAPSRSFTLPSRAPCSSRPCTPPTWAGSGGALVPSQVGPDASGPSTTACIADPPPSQGRATLRRRPNPCPSLLSWCAQTTSRR